MKHIIISFLFIVIASSAASAQCKCGSPANGEITHKGGNELYTQVLPKTYKSIRGVAQQIHGKAMNGVLVELFDNSEWIRQGLSESPVEQRRIATCKTNHDGKFCFKDIPPGQYELRLSLNRAWNVVHTYVEVNPRSSRSTDEGIRILMHPGH